MLRLERWRPRTLAHAHQSEAKRMKWEINWKRERNNVEEEEGKLKPCSIDDDTEENKERVRSCQRKEKKMQEYWYVFLNFSRFVKHHKSWWFGGWDGVWIVVACGCFGGGQDLGSWNFFWVCEASGFWMSLSWSQNLIHIILDLIH